MKKGKMRLILEDHWASFMSKYDKKIRPNVKAEVDKVLRCKDTRYGYIELKCEKCNEIKKIGFTCKSRFCTSCGKIVTYKYTRHEDNKVVVETVEAHEFLKKVIIHIPEKHFKMIRYFGIYSRRSRKKDIFIKMLDEKILSIRKSMFKWEYRILATFGINPCDCPKCGNRMKFHDIVYYRYGSIREYLRKKFINEQKNKLEKAIELYALTKGIMYGRINPTTT